MVTVVRNGHNDTSSNPQPDFCNSYSTNNLVKGINTTILQPVMSQ